MNEEIQGTTSAVLKLAKECGYWSGQTIEMNDIGIEAFYKAAYNKEIEDAAAECLSAAPTIDGSLC